jgi:hypothetical protein
MKFKLLLVALIVTAFSWGQTNIATIGTSYTQDFNSLASSGSGITWTNNITLPGWYAKTDATPSITTYSTNTGTLNTGALYSFGSASAADRGFGMASSNSFTGSSGTAYGYYGWRLKNTTGSTITSLTVTWTGEQWRKEANAASHNLILFYQTATTVTDLTSGTWTNTGSTFTGPKFDATAATALDGNLAANRVAGISVVINVTIAAGDEIMLRWADLNNGGFEHLMCIDDVTVVASNANKVSAANGDWNTAATWTPVGVPTATDNVLILAAHTVYTSTSLTRTGTTTVNGGFQVNGGGYASGTNFVYAATGSSLIMNNGAGLYAISTGQAFWPTTSPPFNVTIQGTGAQINNPVGSVAGTLTVNSQLDCAVANALTVTSTGTALVNNQLSISTANGFTVNGILQLNSGGYINTNSPIYGNASTLKYNSGTAYGRGYEWLALGVGTIGTTAGYPNNVTLSNNTNLNYTNGTPLAKAMYGNLTVDAGSTFSMDYASVTAGGILTVRGDINVAGTLRLGFASGDDLYTPGNLSFTGTGSLVGNGRAIYFTKTGTQTVSSAAAGLTIPYVRTAGSGTTVQLLSDLTISASLGGIALTFGNAADVLDINGRTLTIGTAATANTISGSGTFKGSTTSNLTLLGTGSIGTLTFATDLNLATFTMNRSASATGCVMGSALTVNTALTLTNGLIDLNNTIMTLASGCNNTFTASANSYVIADVSALGALRKVVTATGTTYNFPIGSGTTQYSPATINFASATIAGGAYIGMAVENSKEPNLDAAANYLNRYWEVTSSGITGTLSYNFTGTHLTGEMVGPSTKFANQWNGTAWLNNGSLATGVSPFAVTVSAATTLPVVNHFTAGTRDKEINVVQGSTTYLTGSTYDFGSVTIGSPLVITFTIQNTGQLTLGLTNPAPTMAGSSYYTGGNYSGTPVAGANSGGPGTRTFTITFNPTSAGTFTGSASITNQDADENPYVINFTGDAVCTAANTITPTSGPVGTEVTITATSNNLTGASVTFLGVAASSITVIDATHIKAIVPSGAPNGSGVVTTTNATGCQVSNSFTVDRNLTTSCQGGTNPTELFISEVTDATYGGLTYIEIYNGTGASVNLAPYSLEFFANGSASSYATQALSGTIANGATYTVATALSGFSCGVTGGNGSLANLTSTAAGINFADGTGDQTKGHDHIALFNAGVKKDSWGVYTNDGWATSLGIGDRGADFRRKNNVTLPTTTFSASDWDIINWSGSGSSSCSTNDYSNIGSFNFLAGVPPTVTLHPSYSPTCKATSFTVNGTEGYSGGNTLAFQWYAVAPNVATWTALTNAGLYSGTTTATLTISDISTLVGYQFYCQIRENTATCYSATNAVMINAIPSTTWNGTAWSTGSPPDLNTAAIITGNYNMVSPTSLPSFEACSLTINSPATVTIDDSKYIAIQNDLTVNTGGTLIVRNNGSLVMNDDAGVVTNNGTTQVIRTTAPFELYDYTYWSSPVDATSITSTFTGWRTDYSFEFNTANYSDTNTINSAGTITAAGVPDSFDDFAPWAWLPYTGTMTNGKGYAIMGPTNLGSYPNSTNVTFSGKVNNGVISPSIVESGNAANTADDFNLVGNPYPSAIFANKFITDNGTKTSGSLYFWTHVANVSTSNPGPNLYNFISDDYAVYNMSGGTRASFTGSAVPTGYIASGQGFFVEAQGNNTLTFNNSMRSKTYANNQFFRTSQPNGSIDRVWLNLRSEDGMFGQLLVAYFDDTTLDFDWAYDARVNQTNNYVSFYSMAANEKYKIQARPTFEDSDIVPIGYFSAVTGEFTISIDQKEGALDDESTNIYIEDLKMNIIHNLKLSPYVFTTEYGRFEDRFLLRYTDGALNNPDFDTLSNSVVVASNHGQLTIKSYIQTMEEVTVYDILGRQLFNQKGIGNNDFSATNISLSQQSVIVKIKLESGTIVTKKVLIN